MVSTYQIARRYIPEDSHLQLSRISCQLLTCHLILLDFISLKKQLHTINITRYQRLHRASSLEELLALTKLRI
jgi:hypothetical protein